MPRHTLPGLLSAGLWAAPRDQNWGLPWHYNEGIEITYLRRGALPFAVDGQSLNLHRGDFTITRPWQCHRVGRPDVTAGELCWVILDVGVRHPHQRWQWPDWIALGPGELARLSQLLRYNEQPRWRAITPVSAAFALLADQIEQAAPSYTRIGLAINELLLSIMDLLEGQSIALNRQLVASERSVALFLERLRERCFDPWTLDDMARECDLGRSRFAHYCLQITGMTPMAWLGRHRIEMVCDLLRSTDAESITQIQARCGFSSSQYFSYWFRRQMGCTPSEFRQQHTPHSGRRVGKSTGLRPKSKAHRINAQA